MVIIRFLAVMVLTATPIFANDGPSDVVEKLYRGNIAYSNSLKGARSAERAMKEDKAAFETLTLPYLTARYINVLNEQDKRCRKELETNTDEGCSVEGIECWQENPTKFMVEAPIAVKSPDIHSQYMEKPAPPDSHLAIVRANFCFGCKSFDDRGSTRRYSVLVEKVNNRWLVDKVYCPAFIQAKQDAQLSKQLSDKFFWSETTDGDIAFFKNRDSSAFLFRPYMFDNAPDELSEGYLRIIDESRLIGYADRDGNIVYEPQFVSGTPVQQSKAKVCLEGAVKPLGQKDDEHAYVDCKKEKTIAFKKLPPR